MELVIGPKSNPAAIDELIIVLEALKLSDATLYVGYPVFSTQDETVRVDALLISRQHGLVLFQFPEEEPGSSKSWDEKYFEAEDNSLQLQAALTAKFLPLRELRVGPLLAFPIQIITCFPDASSAPVRPGSNVFGVDQVGVAVKKLPAITTSLLPALIAAVQRVTTIKPRKRRQDVVNQASRGGILKQIEKKICNLDKWQNRAAIETPDVPQRIRGLAGSGKTIVLALKAAYLHQRNPDWSIAVTYYTRSLHAQFVDLIRRFYFDATQDEPDWTKLQVMHCWGGRGKGGVYSQIAGAYDQSPKDLAYGRAKYTNDEVFGGICGELLSIVETLPPKPLYDVLLIDEAQDLPSSFLKLAWYATKDHHRLSWAYDELQNLSAYSMAPPEDLFGNDPITNRPRVTLRNDDSRLNPHQDILLPVCYRNSPWALTVAHALGFGVYRERGYVQLFDDVSIWEQIGYKVIEGRLAAGSRVKLKRSETATPAFFGELLTHQDAIVTKAFDRNAEQIDWVADSILKNLNEDELDHDDILVIFPDPISAASRCGLLRTALAARGITSHLTGVDRARDEFFALNSIAMSGIYRAKGNEAPMVYIMDSEYCLGGSELIRKRNTLFTAITRSRAWVRICGCGDGMKALELEVQKVIANDFCLEFVVTTELENDKLRRIHKDLSAEERVRQAKKVSAAESALEDIQSGELSIEDLSPEIKDLIKKLAGKL